MQPEPCRPRPGSQGPGAAYCGLILAVALAIGQVSARGAPKLAHPENHGCTADDFVDLVLRSMPQGYEISCDRVVIIKNFDVFLHDRPDVQAKPELVEKAHRSIAFTVNSTWPVYFNFEQYKPLAEAYARTHEQAIIWTMVAVAGHERTHATGHANESDALLTELSLISRFIHEGKIPNTFKIDLEELKQQFIRAVQSESAATR
jgi:hypothetical protein